MHETRCVFLVAHVLEKAMLWKTVSLPSNTSSFTKSIVLYQIDCSTNEGTKCIISARLQMVQMVIQTFALVLKLSIVLWSKFRSQKLGYSSRFQKLVHSGSTRKIRPGAYYCFQRGLFSTDSCVSISKKS